MSSTLYRKYRPQNFSQVVGQKIIVQTLTNALKSDRVSHAYLFTGPRGTGKTTFARIFAKSVNCEQRKSGNAEPCGNCKSCKLIGDGKSLDIIEIDAASNTGVDNIRELRETVKLPPTHGKYKVYIIDEVHMLSTGAFNALLKTLEEPPAHAIFILATTEIHKIPETIISRCQRFDFSRISTQQIIEKLKTIAVGEGISVDADSLEMIALDAEGGMRDAESLLSQVMTSDKSAITSRDVESILGTTDAFRVEQFARLLIQKNTAEALKFITSVSQEGFNLEIFSKRLVALFRKIIILSIDSRLSLYVTEELTQEQKDSLQILAESSSTGQLVALIEAFTKIIPEMKSAFIPQLPLEIATIRSTQSFQAIIQEKPIVKTKSEDAPKITQSTSTPSESRPPIKPSETKDTVDASIVAPDQSEKKPLLSNPVTLDQIRASWNEFVQSVRPHNHSLVAVLANCQPHRIDNNELTIVTKYAFYKDRLNEVPNALTLSEVLGTLVKSRVNVHAITEEEAGITLPNPNQELDTQPVESSEPRETGDLLSDAIDVFGGKVVKE